MAAPLGVDDQIEPKALHAGEILVGPHPAQPVHALWGPQVHGPVLAHEVIVRVVHGYAGQGDACGLQLPEHDAHHGVVVAVVLSLRAPRVVGHVAAVAPVGEVRQQEEADVRMGLTHESHVIDQFVGRLLHRIESPAVPSVLGVHQPTDRTVEVQEVHPPARRVELRHLCQFDPGGSLAVGLVHRGEVQRPAAFNGDLIPASPDQSHELSQLLGARTIDHVDVELDAGEVLTHERPRGIGLQQIEHTLARAEPDLRWSPRGRPHRCTNRQNCKDCTCTLCHRCIAGPWPAPAAYFHFYPPDVSMAHRGRDRLGARPREGPKVAGLDAAPVTLMATSRMTALPSLSVTVK